MKNLLMIALAVCLLTGSAFAGHVDTYGIGSRAVSMGGAMTAGTNDAFSVYYNPAAMSRIKKRTFTIGSHFVDPRLEIRDFEADMTVTGGIPEQNPSADKIEDKAPLLIVPHMGYVHPLNSKFTLGVALYVPYGLSLEWERNAAVNPGAYNTYKSYYMREVITPSISYKVNDKLSIGFGISIGKTQAGSERIRYVPDFMQDDSTMTALAYQQAYSTAINAGYSAAAANAAASAASTTQGPAAAAAYRDLDGSQYQTHMEDNFNYSFNFGILYEFNEKVSVGLTYRGKAKTNLEGDVDVKPTPIYWQNYKQDASTDIDTPDQVQFGVEYKPTEKWAINADITRTWWSNIQSYTVKFDEPFMATPVLAPDGMAEEHFERKWKDTWQYRIGTEYKLNKTVDLRAGYYYDPTVVPDSTMDIQWPDSDKHVFSGGVGLHFGRVDIDLALQYIKVTTIDIASGESENLNHSFHRDIHDGDVSLKADGTIIGYGVTISYKF